MTRSTPPSPANDDAPRPSVLAPIVLVHLGASLAPFFFSWGAVMVCALLYYLTMAFGITLGYHRLLSHRSFRAPKWLEYGLATLGALAMQGGPIEWVGDHRNHHIHSDQDGDPHAASKGFWWSHILWLFEPRASMDELRKRTGDLNADPYLEFLESYYVPLQIALGILLYAIGGLGFVVYGVFLRLTLTYHATWLINSVSHKFGYVSYRTNDTSRNCWWATLLTFGEGWHNNHHAFPHSARHGLRWWEMDVTWMTIRALNALGIVDDIKMAKPHHRERRSNESAAL